MTNLLSKSNFQKLYEKFNKAIEANDKDQLNQLATSVLIADLSDIVNKLSNSKTIFVFQNLKTHIAHLLFVHLDVETQIQVVEGISADELNALFASIPEKEIVDIIYVMPTKIVKKIESHLSGKKLERVIKAEKKNDNNIGAITKPSFVTVLEGHTIGESIDTMKAKYESKEIESFAIIYVHDKKDKLIGFIKLREFLFGKRNDQVEDVMTGITSLLHPSDTIEKAAALIGKYKLPMMPVVNSHGQQVGIVLSSDIALAVQAKATRDIQKMAAVSTMKGQPEQPYIKTSIGRIYKSRIVWIVMLMIAATFSQVLMEDETKFPVEFLTAVAPVIPLLMGTAGNAGGQASSTIIRSLSLGEITTKDYAKVVWKEVRVSLIIGITVFVVNVFRMAFTMLVISGKQIDEVISVSSPVVWASAAMLTIVVIAKFLGASMPMLAKKLKLDPALVAGPFIATFIDLLSIVTMLFWWTLLV